MLLVKGAVINGKYTNCYNNEAKNRPRIE